jgi:hypothetical protein
MSEQFETRLAEWFMDRLADTPPQGGQKLLVEFHDFETTDVFAGSLMEMADEDAYPVIGDKEQTLPAIIPKGGVPTYLARVKSSVSDDPEPYEITQGYATQMRNKTSSSVQTDEPRAFLMVLESDTTLDTLEASEQLFGDEGILNLGDFRQTVLDASTCDTTPGKALLEALDNVLGEDTTYAADVEVLNTLCRIRDAVDERRAKDLPSLIAELPEFIREDFIDSDWFTQQEGQDTIRETAENLLSDNQRHAAQLRRAHRTGTDTESKLSSNYEKSFVKKVLDEPTWKNLKHTEVKKHEQTRTSRQFRKLEITAANHRLYSPPEADEIRRSVIALPQNGILKLAAEFSADLEDTPYEFIGPDGDDIGSTSKYENRVTATLGNISTTEPTFARFNFYVGKKTTRGKPTHQFDVAAVPQWFYDVTDDITLDVGVEGERVIRHGDDEIRLTPPQRLDFDYERSETEVKLTSETNKTIEFTEPVLINPSPPEAVEQVGFLLAPPNEIPINIVFFTEVSTAETEELTFPLMLAAISDPDRWAVDDLHLPDSLSIDTGRGEIYTATEEGIRIEEEALELIQIEEEIARKGVPNQRTTDSDKHQAGSVENNKELAAFDSLSKAYSDLFDHFNDRNRTPSTDPWDTVTQERVATVLNAYQEAIESVGEQPSFEQYEPLRGLGMIHSTTTDKTWLTPYHPIKLAYALRIARWRDSTLHATDSVDGFRSERFIDQFNSSGLLPYIVPQDGSDILLRGIQYGQNSLWSVHSPVDSPGSVTPDYMERVVRDKLDTFVKSFPLLFKLHGGRSLKVNLVNLGDLRPVVKGLYEFYKRIRKTSFDPPQILLRIYGGQSEGEALVRFFGKNRKSRLRTQLEQKNDEIVDILRSNVMYVLEDEYTSESHEEAHLTFFRGLLTEEPGLTKVNDLESSLHLGGLLPQESIDVREEQSGTVYSVGFGYDGEDGEIGETAKLANTLEAGKQNGNYLPNHILKKTIKSSQKTDLQQLWDDTLWAVHVQPNVDLNFYTESQNEIGSDDGMVMIHYSDKYDSSSPNYDVITSTTKRRPYITALRRALDDVEIAGHLDPERVLSTLIAIDGEMALELQRADDKTIVEKIGFAGGLALSRRLLQQESDNYTWVPLGLEELARHDRASRGSGPGLLQYDDYNPASDDICLVGVPKRPEQIGLKLWIVETKGGTSKVKKGREQVEGALRELKSIFNPNSNYSDHDLLYSEFGKTVIDVTQRMHSYDVLTDEEAETVFAAADALREGNFDISFATDSDGHIGEVIRVRSGNLLTELNLEHSVRSIEVPLKVMNLLEDNDIDSILPDLNLDHVEFNFSTIDRSTGPETDTTESNIGSDEESPQMRDDDDEATEQSSGVDVGSNSAKSHTDGGPFTAPSPKGADAGETDQEAQSGDSESTTHAPAVYKDILAQMETSPEPETSVNRSQLVSDLKREFESLGVDIHPPNPSTISVGARKIGVNVHPKEGQTVEGMISQLNSLSVHIQAGGEIAGQVIPSEGAVRLEIPHDDPTDVMLREGIEALADEFDSPVTIPLGVDTESKHHSLSMLDEKHALISGATGSGKSNFLSTIVSSLAILNDPDEVSISILDPKGVDFGRFESLPHVQNGAYLDTPKECTDYLINLLENDLPKRKTHLQESGFTSVAELNEYADEMGHERMSYRVIVIDEYADLIMSLSDGEDEFEDAVTRLAQKGRALGYVLFLATQRPSANIVSGKIKANFPCRISFRLPSNTDSRVILDQPGAEDLQGAGDMIAITQAGQLNLQGYRLTPKDAIAVRKRLSRVKTLE